MVAFNNLVVRSVRRVRLEFSTALAAGAFVTSWFTVVSEDSATGDPVVVAALAVPTLTNYVELALDRDLAEGGQYTLHVASGVPAADASTAPAAVQYFYPPTAAPAPSEAMSAQDLLRVIFQEDVAHDPAKGHTFAPDGDLAIVDGPENVKATQTRGLLSSGLIHRFGWGAKLREFVDAPSLMLPTLRGRIERQLRRDDRVTDARGSMQQGSNGEHFAVAEITLVGQVRTNLREKVNARR
jgi:hypothetical protein